MMMALLRYMNPIDLVITALTGQYLHAGTPDCPTQRYTNIAPSSQTTLPRIERHDLCEACRQLEGGEGDLQRSTAGAKMGAD